MAEPAASAYSKGNCIWLCRWEKKWEKTLLLEDLMPWLMPLSATPAISMWCISLVAWRCMGLKVPSFSLLILKALSLFKQDGFHFYPFLCPPAEHSNPYDVTCLHACNCWLTQGRKTWQRSEIVAECNQVFIFFKKKKNCCCFCEYEMLSMKYRRPLFEAKGNKEE